MAYFVEAPLVVAKDREGRNHHCYRGSIIHWLGDEQRDRWLRLGLVREIEEDAPVPSTLQSEPLPDAQAEKPKKVAPKEDWVRFGVSKGNSQAELEALTKDELVDLLGDF